jgi:hypothetical protein
MKGGCVENVANAEKAAWRLQFSCGSCWEKFNVVSILFYQWLCVSIIFWLSGLCLQATFISILFCSFYSLFWYLSTWYLWGREMTICHFLFKYSTSVFVWPLSLLWLSADVAGLWSPPSVILEKPGGLIPFCISHFL